MKFPASLFGVFALSIISCARAQMAFKVVESLGAVPQGWTQGAPAEWPTTIKLHLALVQPHFEALEERMLAIATPFHPYYGKHLSREQLQVLQEPAAEAIDVVLDTLNFLDIPDGTIKRKGHWITIETNITTAEKLLNTRFHYFTNQHGQQIVRTLEYSVPKSICQLVEMVQPTTHFGHVYPHSRKVLKAEPVATLHNVPDSFDPLGCNMTVTPTCLRGLYGLGDDPNMTGTSNSSYGNILGISGFLEEYARFNDLRRFTKDFAPYISSKNFSAVLVNGGQNLQDDVTHDSAEAALDIQYTMALAPSVPIRYYSTGGRGPSVPEVDQPSLGDVAHEPYLEELQYLLNLDDADLPTVLSTSYGEGEQSLPRSYSIEVCRLFLALGARGVSVIFSSGDTGPGSSCESNDGKSSTLYLPIFPASCPYVTSVGGTERVAPEHAATFSSGGFSNVFARPSYQDDAVSEYLKCYGNATDPSVFTSNGRGFPDVSAQASNFLIIDKGKLQQVSGTSAAAPVFAAIIANLNAIRTSLGLPPLGFLNPFLYGHGRDGLTDITVGGSTGCSGLQGRFVANAGWNATDGWDPVTGLGTPNFPKLAAASLSSILKLTV